VTITPITLKLGESANNYSRRYEFYTERNTGAAPRLTPAGPVEEIVGRNSSPMTSLATAKLVFMSFSCVNGKQGLFGSN